MLVDQPAQGQVGSQARPDKNEIKTNKNVENDVDGSDFSSTLEDKDVNQCEDDQHATDDQLVYVRDHAGKDDAIQEEDCVGKVDVTHVPVFSDILSPQDINRSLLTWIKDLQKNIPVKRLSSLSKQLNCFTDAQGIVRCKGRLEHSNLPYNQKFPILLDGNHPLVKLLILQDS